LPITTAAPDVGSIAAFLPHALLHSSRIGGTLRQLDYRMCDSGLAAGWPLSRLLLFLPVVMQCVLGYGLPGLCR